MFVSFVRLQPATASSEVQSATQFPSRSISSPTMRCELDEDRPAGHAEQLDAGVDDRSTQSQPLLCCATATKLDQDHGDGLEAVEAEAIKIVLAEFGKADVRPATTASP